MTELNTSRPSAPSAPLGIEWAFLRRTGIATVVTVLLIALFSALYYDLAWAGRYLFFGLWSITFFASSAMIFKTMLFERRRALGFVFIALKIATLVAAALVLMFWRVPEQLVRAHSLAMLFGILTPFTVLILRTLGLMMEISRRDQILLAQKKDRADANRSAISSGEELNTHA